MAMTQRFLDNAAASDPQNLDTSYEWSVRDGVSEIVLGFQPMGIQIRGSRCVIADYYAPAFCEMDLSFDATSGIIQFSDICWVNNVLFHGTSIRMFPQDLQYGDANRLQAIVIHNSGNVAITRNGERTLHWLSRIGKGWEYHTREDLTDSGYDMVHSATMLESQLLTIETRNKFTEWALCRYTLSALKIEFLNDTPIPPFTYGIAMSDPETIFTVTDPRATQYGILKNHSRIGINITGNGIALIDDGHSGALITQYGQALSGPFRGQPGKLLYVPPKLLGF